MSELPRHPKYNSLNNGSNKYGRDRLLDTIKQFELWDDAIALANTPALEPTDRPEEQLRRLRLLGMAWFRKGNAEEGNKVLEELRARWQNELASRDRAGEEADRAARGERKNDGDREKSRNDRRRTFAQRTEQVEKAIQELEGHAAVLAGNFKQGYELLSKAGGLDRGYLAMIQYQAGETEQALKAAADHAKSRQQETLPLAHRVALLWHAGQRDEAKAELEKLRQVSGSIDLSAPPFARLTPIAMELGIGENWVVAKSPAADTGVRPLLDSLGPFRWQPSPAASWALNDAEGKSHSLADYQGKPIVLIFYLGHGCLHCAQQLKTFGPKMKEFQEAGLEVVAISSDDDAGLKVSIENYKEPIPFLLLSNADLSVFKGYRCHDDFEQQPLHGTFIIDGQGLVRWQDISADPFMDADFVLKEAKRLLAQRPTTVVSQPAAPAAAGGQ